MLCSSASSLSAASPAAASASTMAARRRTLVAASSATATTTAAAVAAATTRAATPASTLAALGVRRLPSNTRAPFFASPASSTTTTTPFVARRTLAFSAFERFMHRPSRLNTHRAPLAKGTVTPPRAVPSHISRPSYADSGVLAARAPHVEVKDAATIARMRRANALAARVLEAAGRAVRVGITTDDIDALVHTLVVDAGAYPSPLNYAGFPKSACTSVNEVLCHGVPDSTRLENGDLVSIDVSVFVDGVHGDCCATFAVGDAVRDEHRALSRFALHCTDSSVALCAPGVPISAIGRHISQLCAAARSDDDNVRYESAMHFTGHGIGAEMHMAPNVYHTASLADDCVMQPGMTFTIEPIITEGNSSELVQWDDAWTVAAKDGGWAAQWERCVLITDSGHEVLTDWDIPA